VRVAESFGARGIGLIGSIKVASLEHAAHGFLRTGIANT
jgi:hypothetical protein